MIDELLKALIGSDADAGTEELIDILWLAARVDSGASAAPVGPNAVTDAESPPPDSSQPQSTSTTPTPGAPLYTVGQLADGAAETNKQGVRVRVRRAASLRDPLAIMRALRPLGRRSNCVSDHAELDEEATVTASIEQHMLMPVFRQAEDRWLHVAIVVDTNPSMLLWHDLVQELRRTITQTGLFATVRTWYLLGTQGEIKPAIAPRPGDAPRSPQEIAAPTGRRLILVLTDTVADGWSHGSLHGILRQWCTHSAVAVLNVLPERLWSSGAVHPVPLMVRAGAPAAPTVSWNHAEVRSRRRRPSAPSVALPVIDTTVASIAALAGLIAGDGAWRRMRCLRIETAPKEVPHPPVSQPTRTTAKDAGHAIDKAEAIRHFRETASPIAQELAGYLSAVPLTLPVINLVRQVMLPHSDIGHLAEVALSGLLTPWEAADASIDRWHLQFAPGVREALLGSQLRQDITTVQELVRRELSAYVSQRGGTAGDFAVTQSAPSGNLSIPPDALPFADANSLSAVADRERTAEDVPAADEGRYRAHTTSPETAGANRGRTYLLEDFPAAIPPPSDSAPFQLLEPEHQAVPFTGREREISTLLSWWHDERKFGDEGPYFFIIQAKGGQGKTRLAMRFADLVRMEGFSVWQARTRGVATSTADRALTARELPPRVLIVADYADTWATHDARKLFEELASHRGSSKIHVLLLVRSWKRWHNLLRAQIRREIAVTVMELPSLADSPSARLALFNSARKAFAAHLGLSHEKNRHIGPPAALEQDPTFDSVATIHASALQQVLIALEHPSNGSVVAPHHVDSRPGRIVMVATLPVPVLAGSKIARATTGYALSSRLILTAAHTLPTDSPYGLRVRTAPTTVTTTDWIDCHVLWVHPGEDVALLSADEDIVEPDEPEPLLADPAQIQSGESAMITMLGYPDGTDRVLNAIKLAGTLQVTSNQPWLEFEPEFSIDAVNQPLLAGAPVTIDGALIGIVDSRRRSRSRLRIISLAALESDKHSFQLVSSLHLKSTADPTVTEEKVRKLRHLAIENPDAHLPQLARSLNNLAQQFDKRGQLAEALDAVRESVHVIRRLADQDPATHLPDLAASLNNLSVALGEVGLQEEALDAITEAVEIRRRLADQYPSTHLPDLATSLYSLAVALVQLGRQEETSAAITEAAAVYRRLADQRPDVFLPDLAASLNNLSVVLGQLGLQEKALDAITEAVEIRRRLADQRPDKFLPDLATGLNNLSVVLGQLGLQEKALDAITEAVEIRRRLADQRPDKFLPDLATR
ncbi:SAV_2336 N-terminal domain-related protein, partial [Amycolatopsis thailandensis]|uniref:SAV_2336 N-terminal domain-related protein n=1 Tax=Amycolatopsis thailandensis TaxID=589330 RepID=UPI00362840E9